VVTARRAGDAATEAAALVTLACAEPIGGNVEQIQAVLAQARAVASRVSASEPFLAAAIAESETLKYAGLHEQAATVAREGLAAAGEYGLARTYGAVLAGSLAEPLLSLGRWDEANEIIEGALQLFPLQLDRTCLWRLAGDIALARGDLVAAAESVASIKSVLDHARYQSQYHLPLIRLESQVRLSQGGRAQALSVIHDALDRFDVRQSPRHAWPLLVAGTRACAAAAAYRTLLPEAGAMLDRLRAEAGMPAAEGAAQRAHQLTTVVLAWPDDISRAEPDLDAVRGIVARRIARTATRLEDTYGPPRSPECRSRAEPPTAGGQPRRTRQIGGYGSQSGLG